MDNIRAVLNIYINLFHYSPTNLTYVRIQEGGVADASSPDELRVLIVCNSRGQTSKYKYIGNFGLLNLFGSRLPAYVRGAYHEILYTASSSAGATLLIALFTAFRMADGMAGNWGSNDNAVVRFFHSRAQMHTT